jgi:hypothetical protein
VIEGELVGLWIVMATAFLGLFGLCLYLAYRVDRLGRDVAQLQEAARRGRS